MVFADSIPAESTKLSMAGTALFASGAATAVSAAFSGATLAVARLYNLKYVSRTHACEAFRPPYGR